MRFTICDLRFTSGRRNSTPRDHSPFVIRHSSFVNGFTLLEVIVACAIFFMVAFAVLELVTRGLAAAKALQQREPDAGILAAAMSLTNKLEEGTMSGNFEDLAPGLYPGYSWARDAYEVGSNGLFQVDFVVVRQSGKGHGPSETKMSILMYRPGSQPGNRFGGGVGGRP
jgi:pilin/secretion family protein with methylation motif